MDYSQLNYSELNFLIEFIIIRYMKSEAYLSDLCFFQVQEVNNNINPDKFSTIVRKALNKLDSDEYRIFYEDYFMKTDRYWWQEYYSKSSYYRIKKLAMFKFLNCLHQ